jgi:TonB family protein
MFSENIPQQDTVFPSFIGGNNALSKYLFPYFNYTDNLFPNNEPIKVFFNVLENGKTSNIYFEKKYYNKIFVDSIASAIENMPKWNPATIFNIPTKLSYYLTFYNNNRTHPVHPDFIYKQQAKIQIQQNKDSQKEPVILTRSEVMPKFICKEDIYDKYDYPKGTNCVNQFIEDNLIYPNPLPENFEGGKVIVNLYIDEEGNVCNPNIVKNPFNDERFAEAALEVVKKMPAWEPGKQNNIPAKVYYTMPVTFKLQ